MQQIAERTHKETENNKAVAGQWEHIDEAERRFLTWLLELCLDESPEAGNGANPAFGPDTRDPRGPHILVI